MRGVSRQITTSINICLQIQIQIQISFLKGEKRFQSISRILVTNVDHLSICPKYPYLKKVWLVLTLLEIKCHPKNSIFPQKHLFQREGKGYLRVVNKLFGHNVLSFHDINTYPASKYDFNTSTNFPLNPSGPLL